MEGNYEGLSKAMEENGRSTEAVKEAHRSRETMRVVGEPWKSLWSLGKTSLERGRGRPAMSGSRVALWLIKIITTFRRRHYKSRDQRVVLPVLPPAV